VPIEFTNLDDVDSVLAVNLHGVVRATKAFAPALRQAKGRIVNVGSVQGMIAPPDSGAYSMSKFALEALTDSLRIEMSFHGVSVSMINPGYIKTNIAAKQIGEDGAHSKLSKEQVRCWW
jgi:NAD(P)-dependent dehydrogenase (short-subunit alcohol dehydrogenase family)